MVYLRWCQSRTQFAKTTTTTDARITQKETPKLKYSNVLKLHVQNCVGMSQMWQPINKKTIYKLNLFILNQREQLKSTMIIEDWKKINLTEYLCNN